MDRMPSMYLTAIRRMDSYKPQRWHVEYSDNDGETKTESFATRRVAEEVAYESAGIFCLCDCPGRDCLFE